VVTPYAEDGNVASAPGVGLGFLAIGLGFMADFLEPERKSAELSFSFDQDDRVGKE